MSDRPPVPTPAPDPGPEIAVGPVLEGYAVCYLYPPQGGGERVRITAPVQAARVNGTWTIVPSTEMRAALEESVGAGTVATPAPSAAAVGGD